MQPVNLTYLVRLSICSLIFLATPAHAADLDRVIETLINDIQRSQQLLDQETVRIAQENNALAEDLAKDVRGLRKLRDRAAVVRRQSDERTVSLVSLEERINGWRQQDSYRKNLIQDFVSRRMTNVAGLNDIELLQRAIEELETGLEPTFTPVDALTETGEVIRPDHLRLGPIHWFRTPETAGTT
ncbi:MAG: hypothetical protein AAF525_13915, partial [Pseudomonadota bacterium]